MDTYCPLGSAEVTRWRHHELIVVDFAHSANIYHHLQSFHVGWLCGSSELAQTCPNLGRWQQVI